MSDYTKGFTVGILTAIIAIIVNAFLPPYNQNTLANGSCVRDVFTGETGMVVNQTVDFSKDMKVVMMPYTFIYRSNDGSLIGQKGSRASTQFKYPAELQSIPCSSANIPFHQ